MNNKTLIDSLSTTLEANRLKALETYYEHLKSADNQFQSFAEERNRGTASRKLGLLQGMLETLANQTDKDESDLAQQALRYAEKISTKSLTYLHRDWSKVSADQTRYLELAYRALGHWPEEATRRVASAKPEKLINAAMQQVANEELNADQARVMLANAMYSQIRYPAVDDAQSLIGDFKIERRSFWFKGHVIESLLSVRDSGYNVRGVPVLFFTEYAWGQPSFTEEDDICKPSSIRKGVVIGRQRSPVYSFIGVTQSQSTFITESHARESFTFMNVLCDEFSLQLQGLISDIRKQHTVPAAAQVRISSLVLNQRYREKGYHKEKLYPDTAERAEQLFEELTPAWGKTKYLDRQYCFGTAPFDEAKHKELDVEVDPRWKLYVPQV